MISKQVSSDGSCIVWNQCLGTRYYHQRKRSVLLVATQDEWVATHDVFMSAGRVYSDILIHNREFIMDAVTGTLYYKSGMCISTQDLNVNPKDKNYRKVDVLKFVRDRY